MSLNLRPYQLAAVANTRAAVLAGSKAPLIVSPTGSGKTVLGAHMLESCVGLGGNASFLTGRMELTDQTSRKLDEAQLDHGVIQADHWRWRPHLPVQVASIHTLHKRGYRPQASLVIADEAHTALSPSYRGLLDAYRADGATVVGLTATPYPPNGSMSDFFDSLTVVAQVDELIRAGYLVPIEVYAPNDPAVANVRIKGGDFDPTELEAAVNKPAIVGDIVQTWKRLAAGRTTAVFAVSKKHARDLQSEFVTQGIPCEYLDDETPGPQRRAVQERIASGESLVVVNVGILSIGWDMPRVSCVVMARHTLSRALYRQMVGRGTRPWCVICGGTSRSCTSPLHKQNLIVLDHVGNVYRHGLPDEPEEFSLNMNGRLKATDRAKGLRKCLNPGCYGKTSPAGSKSCDHCGLPFPARERSLVFRDGTLESFGSSVEGPARRQVTSDPAERARLLAKWTARAALAHNKLGQASVVYKSTFGCWPEPEIVAASVIVPWPRYLVANGRCRHCQSTAVHTVPAPPHAAQVVCSACARGLAWVDDEFAPLVATSPAPATTDLFAAAGVA